MKIRSFEVLRKGKRYVIFLRGVELAAIDKVHVQRDRSLLDKLVDRLHNQLHPVLKQIEERPERFGELLAEFNGVPV